MKLKNVIASKINKLSTDNKNLINLHLILASLCLDSSNRLNNLVNAYEFTQKIPKKERLSALDECGKQALELFAEQETLLLELNKFIRLLVDNTNSVYGKIRELDDKRIDNIMALVMTLPCVK